MVLSKRQIDLKLFVLHLLPTFAEIGPEENMSCSEYEYETDSGCLSVKVRMKEEVIVGGGTQHLGEAAI